jgi:hypothetical protein
MIDKELHCFETTAIAKSVHDAMDEDNLWPDVETMMPRMFLPSPTTWLEMTVPGKDFRVAWILQESGDGFRLSMAGEGPRVPYSTPVCTFRARGILEVGERIEQVGLVEEAFVKDEVADKRARSLLSSILLTGHDQEAQLVAQIGLLNLEIDRHSREVRFLDGMIETGEFINHGIVFAVLLLDLINTPGLVGLRQHDPHRGLARRLGGYRGGSYPLRGWSEVVLKHQTRIAGDTEHQTGATFHKCLHFVRAHLRHYRDGKVTVIPAHWRGDPALGIKRTRYLVAA